MIPKGFENLYSIHMFAVTYFPLSDTFDSSDAMCLLARSFDCQTNIIDKKEKICWFLLKMEWRLFLWVSNKSNGQLCTMHFQHHHQTNIRLALCLMQWNYFCARKHIWVHFRWDWIFALLSCTNEKEKKKASRSEIKKAARNVCGIFRSLVNVCECFDYILLPLKLRLIASEWAEVPFYLEYQ